MPEETIKCRRCLNVAPAPGYLMAGQRYCCQSCSVGSACEHQNTRRASTVRRFDSNFDSFRKVVKHSTPYEPIRLKRQ